MNSEPLDRFERLFRAARLHPPEERDAFLDAACGDDPALRRQLDELLRADAEATGEAFLAMPAARSSPDPLDPAPDQQIGPYVIQRRIGYGGMGDVFLARRDAPFKRYVALKVIRRGMDTDEVLARFAVERQILASLDHPHVARLIDGGVTEDGRPYFAMEYVDGVPITDYCDQHRLTVDERLRLFQTVCQAVQYAHQNLILHRDLKPSNILVTAEGTVKLLDFGIAKLLNPSLSPMTLPLTQTAFRVMTPAYASPEQVRGESLTTASDVYALGVLLYELLTGHRPYRLSQRSTDEVMRVVCEQEPERPSTKVGRTEQVTDSDGATATLTPAQIGAARSASAERLRRRLRGDLDNIVMVALRKEAARRYASAEQFADDIERYLGGQPVSARPSTMGYRVRKFVQRHRTGVAAAALVVLALVAGLGTAVWQAGKARQERDRANEARLQAEQALRRSAAVTDFMIGLFEASDPATSQGEETTARELLERGVARAEELAGQPAVQGEMLDVMGQVYQNLGRYDRAEDLLDRALALRTRYAGTGSADVAASRAHQANLLRLRGRYPEAESLYQHVLTVRRRLFGNTHPQVAETLIDLGRVAQDRGDFDRAEPLFRDGLAIQQAHYGDTHPDVLRTRSELARVLYGRGAYDEAEAVLQQTLTLREQVYGQVHPEVADNLIQLGSLYATRDDDFVRAEEYHRRALSIRETLYGDAHPLVAKSLIHVANALVFQERYDEAEPLLRRAITIQRAALGDGHPDVGTALNTLALMLLDQGRLDEAEQYFQEALASYQQAFGAEHHYTAAIIGNLARVALERGDLSGAEARLRRGLAIRRNALGADHPYVTGTRRQLADVLQRQGRFAEAEALYLETQAGYERRPPGGETLHVFYGELAALYDAWGKPDEAARYRALQEGSPTVR